MIGYVFYTLWTITRLSWCPLFWHSFKPLTDGARMWSDGKEITHVCWCGAEKTITGEVLQGTRGVMG